MVHGQFDYGKACDTLMLVEVFNRPETLKDVSIFSQYTKSKLTTYLANCIKMLKKHVFDANFFTQPCCIGGTTVRREVRVRKFLWSKYFLFQICIKTFKKLKVFDAKKSANHGAKGTHCESEVRVRKKVLVKLFCPKIA